MRSPINLLVATLVSALVSATPSRASECDGVLWEKPRLFPPRPQSGGIIGRAQVVKSHPVVVRNQDGRLELFAIGTSGDLLHSWQDKNGSWGDLYSLGTPERVVFAPTASDYHLTAASGIGGRIYVFAIGGGGIWQIHQGIPNGSFGFWRRLARFSESFRPVRLWAVANEDGRIDLFALNAADHRLYHTWQVGTRGAWINQFQDFGNPPTLSWGPYVFSYDAKLRIVVAIGADNGAQVRRQVAPNSGWLEWEHLNSAPATHLEATALGRNTGGRLELIGIERLSGKFHHTWQTGPDTWSGIWSTLGAPADEWWSEAATVASGPDGCLAVVSLVRAPNNERWLATRSQRNAGADWRDWTHKRIRTPWPFSSGTAELVVARHPFRPLELFARTADGALIYSKQVYGEYIPATPTLSGPGGFNR